MNKKLISILRLSCVVTLILLGCGENASEPDNSQTKSGWEISLPSLAGNVAEPLPKEHHIVYLNGIWQFTPATNSERIPTSGWGKMSVPGDWQKPYPDTAPGLVKRGTGPLWEKYEPRDIWKAWYQRDIEIPSDWKGTRVVLELGRVSTDAVVYLNGIKSGEINWPYGTVDLTKSIIPGKSNTLSILVAAAADEKEKMVIMGPTEMYKTKANLDSRGLIGEVRLQSFPQGAYINDIFVQPSTRNKKITLDLELKDIKTPGNVGILAQMLDESGKVEKQFTTQTTVKSTPNQTVKVQFDWSNPRLWDIGKPALYTLRLKIQGDGIYDVYDQSFGFREFWIEGRKFYLNGTELNLRPILFEDQWQGWAVGMPDVIDRMLEGYKKSGFNIVQLWPWNHDERGKWHFRELITQRASQKGFPVIAPALDTTHNDYLDKWNALIGSNGKQNWEPRMVAELRRYRNEPSVLMWSNSPNFFGHSDDQNPFRIGKKKLEGSINNVEDKRMKILIPIGEDIVTTIKKYDPTRPVFMHQGAMVGDVYALNSYLNFIPLQEREEWLSEWSKKGEVPYMVVEFGTPLHVTFSRGRKGFGASIHSEPWMTEFSAIYLGNEAYKLETPQYRQLIRDSFKGTQYYNSLMGKSEIDYAPAFQKIQQLFDTNTWRSWRTFGMSGGMIPWNNSQGWQNITKNDDKVTVGKFTPNHRGPYLEKVRKKLWDYLQPSAYKIQPGGEAIIQNNGPTLAWIAGSQEAFTAKDHNFNPGQKLEKQVVIINDTRQSQNFDFYWEVKIGNKKIADGSKSGNINTAGKQFFPINATFPKDFSQKEDGEIYLKAKVGDFTHEDRFSFRVFPPLSKDNRALMVFDPVGKTTTFLKQLGYRVTPWNGNPNKNDVLIIGREALSSGGKLPGDFENFIKNGGRAIAFTQNPSWLSNNIGFRVSPHLSRRVFPINNNHPIVSGLDATDLRDWIGESTLIEPYRDLQKTGENPYQKYGWRWGGRGAVSSASMEKPHRSSWRPILESEFDLAYAPLMELDYGKGRLILNTLDVEDHGLKDAAAAKITQQLINYATTAPVSPKANQVILIGDDSDGNLLNDLGVIYTQENGSNSFTPGNLYVIGAKQTPKESDLNAFLNKGGKVLFLPRQSNNLFGVTIAPVKDFHGSLNVPQGPEFQGISISDLRSRSFYDTWVIKSGGEVSSDGLFSRIKVGEGVAIFAQTDPRVLNADEKTYLRFTRWRQTRVLAQIFANLGATFKVDNQIFKASGKSNEFYHPDYRTDFEFGDNPYRYYRW
jgi:beta-galactosidase